MWLARGRTRTSTKASRIQAGTPAHRVIMPARLPHVPTPEHFGAPGPVGIPLWIGAGSTHSEQHIGSSNRRQLGRQAMRPQTDHRNSLPYRLGMTTSW